MWLHYDTQFGFIFVVFLNLQNNLQSEVIPRVLLTLHRTSAKDEKEEKNIIDYFPSKHCLKISLNEPVYIDTKLPKLPTLVRCVANVFPEYFQVMMIMENERFTIIEKIRQINYLVNSLVKTLLSRNFCLKKQEWN